MPITTTLKFKRVSGRALGALIVAVGGLLASSLPAAASEAENEADYAEYGGAVNYGDVLNDGRRTASQVVITRSIIFAARDRNIGSTADSDIIPPGFFDLGDNRSRGHVIGRQLGGSGDVEANLLALYQNSVNSPAMSDCESEVAGYLEDGSAASDDLYYRVEPIYDLAEQQHPTAVSIYASDNGRVLVNITIANTPDAPVTYGAGNQLC